MIVIAFVFILYFYLKDSQYFPFLKDYISFFIGRVQREFFLNNQYFEK